jgi:hypothetical protein
MDSDALVNEKIDAGAKFLHHFDKAWPLKVAFWLKENSEDSWHLYAASDKIENATIARAYQYAVRIAQESGDPLLDPFEIKLLSTDAPLARSVWEVRQRYPEALKAFFRQCQLGGVPVNAMHLYPSKFVVSAP